MIEIFSKDVAFKLKALAIYQIVFGLLGLGVTFFLILSISLSNILLILICMVPIVLYAYCVYCGVVLFQKKDPALKYTLLNQYLQLVNFSIIGYAFKYIAGLSFFIGVDVTEGFMVNFKFGLFSSWDINIATENSDMIINCNLVALAIIIFINNLRKKILHDQETLILKIGDDIEVDKPLSGIASSQNNSDNHHHS